MLAIVFHVIFIAGCAASATPVQLHHIQIIELRTVILTARAVIVNIDGPQDSDHVAVLPSRVALVPRRSNDAHAGVGEVGVGGRAGRRLVGDLQVHRVGMRQMDRCFAVVRHYRRIQVVFVCILLTATVLTHFIKK